jgi:uncharacterized YigZ family protein
MADDDRYPIPAGRHRVTDEVKGSRFITTAAYAPDSVAAKLHVDGIKEEFADATHNCWAFVAGPPGSTRENGSNDDGEPGGTAGMSILNVLLNSGVGDIAVVVTRYFGGVKLGRGGLARAYGGGAKHVLKELPLTERIVFISLELRVDYPAVDAARRIAREHGGTISGETFDTAALFELEIPAGNRGAFEKAIMEATGGKAEFNPLRS